MILGIDEIEIGTDSSEAASLYKVILEKFLANSTKLIVTTHHKHLAALMADNIHTRLLAATYDYKRACPTFSFCDNNALISCMRPENVEISLCESCGSWAMIWIFFIRGSCDLAAFIRMGI